MNQYLAITAPYIIAITIAFITATGLQLLNLSPSMVGALGGGTGAATAIFYKKTLQPRTSPPATLDQ